MYPSSSSNSSNMAAVAARIQDRAMQLMTEQATLEAAKVELKQVQDDAEREADINRSVRRDLLHINQLRNEVELELYKAQDQSREYSESIEELKQATEEITEETEKVRSQWEDAVCNVYSSHQLEMNIYKRSLEGSIRRYEEKESRRKERLNKIKRKTDLLRREQERFVRETRMLETDIKNLKRTKETEDEKVSTLAKKVKEALGKRTKLRHSFRDARDAYQKASDKMLKLEKECASSHHRT